MKILIAAPLKRKLSKETTASRSRIVYDLAVELAKRSHKVSVLASGDSDIPGVTIIPAIEKAFNETGPHENKYYAEVSTTVQQAYLLKKYAGDFDIIHNHGFPEFVNLMVEHEINTPMITTIHVQTTPELDTALSLSHSPHLIALSNAHKNMFKKTKIERVVYNGIDTEMYKTGHAKNDYLLWVGRVASAKNTYGAYLDAKGVLTALDIAEKANEKLILTGSVEDIEFFEKHIKPRLSDRIQWVGKVSSEQPLAKEEVIKLMQKAKAFLMPINWEEPFGLVVVEAMSCGIPVIAYDRGAMSELIVSGKTGFIVDPESGVDGFVEAIKNLPNIDPENCHKHVEENFSLEKMVDEYENMYKKTGGE